MTHRSLARERGLKTFPHAHGDEPLYDDNLADDILFSLHMWGCSNWQANIIKEDFLSSH